MLRRLIVGLLTLLLVTQGLAPVAAAAADKDQAAGRPARVTADKLNLREGPGSGFAVVRSLTRDTVVTVLQEQGEWWRVRLDDGTTGWVAAKYVALQAAEGTGGGQTPAGEGAAPGAKPAARPAPGAPQGGGGGSALGPVLKWGCLAGAVVAGGLWYSEHSSGNDAYDEYKTLFQKGEYTAAEAKYQETTDHDDKAQVYGIAGGVLFGLFVLQQFVLGGHHSDQAGIEILPPGPPLAMGPQGGALRAELVRVRF